MNKEEEFAVLMMIGVMQYTLESLAKTFEQAHSNNSPLRLAETR